MIFPDDLRGRSTGSGWDASAVVSAQWGRHGHHRSCEEKNFHKEQPTLRVLEVSSAADFSWPGPGTCGSGSSSSWMGMCPKGWWENESKKDELVMPRLTPVTPMPRESGRNIQDQIHIWFLSTASVWLVFLSFNTIFDLFESLTCGHRRSARPSLVDVV